MAEERISKQPLSTFRTSRKSNQSYAYLAEDRPKKVLLVAPTSPYVLGMSKWLSANLGVERLAGHLRAMVTMPRRTT